MTTTDGTFLGVLKDDRDCPFCSAVASARHRFEDGGAIEDDRKAARELCERAGAPALVRDVALTTASLSPMPSGPSPASIARQNLTTGRPR